MSRVSVCIYLSTYLWYVFYIMPYPSLFSLFLSSNSASHTANNIPIILSEDETSTFETIKITSLSCRQHNTETPANILHAAATYFFLQITAITVTTTTPCFTVLAKFILTHVNIIRHATPLLWWMTLGDGRSEHPLPGLISHCHKSIRVSRKFNVFMSPVSFGAPGLTSSRSDR